MNCLRLLSLSGLLYAILACPAQAQVLTGGPYGPPYQPLPPAPYQFVPQHPTPPQPLPAQPVASDDDGCDPNGCLRLGSELWEQMVALIRENARLEATVDKMEEIAELRQRHERAMQEMEQHQHQQLQAARRELEQLGQRMQAAHPGPAARQQVERLKAQLQQLEIETAEKMEAATERTADLEKQLSTTKHHLDEAREREQAWDQERQKLQREISELKKRRN